MTESPPARDERNDHRDSDSDFISEAKSAVGLEIEVDARVAVLARERKRDGGDQSDRFTTISSDGWPETTSCLQTVRRPRRTTLPHTLMRVSRSPREISQRLTTTRGSRSTA